MEACTSINSNTIIHFYIIEINRIKGFLKDAENERIKNTTKKEKKTNE